MPDTDVAYGLNEAAARATRKGKIPWSAEELTFFECLVYLLADNFPSFASVSFVESVAKQAFARASGAEEIHALALLDREGSVIDKYVTGKTRTDAYIRMRSILTDPFETMNTVEECRAQLHLCKRLVDHPSLYNEHYERRVAELVRPQLSSCLGTSSFLGIIEQLPPNPVTILPELLEIAGRLFADATPAEKAMIACALGYIGLPPEGCPEWIREYLAEHPPDA